MNRSLLEQGRKMVLNINMHTLLQLVEEGLNVRL